MKLTKLRFLLLIGILIWVFPFNSFSQDTSLSQVITIKIRNETLKKAINQIEKQTGISFAYSTLADLNKKTSSNFVEEKLSTILDVLLKDTNISYKEIAGKITLFESIKSQTERATIHGYITDVESGEVLIGATIYDKTTMLGCSSNAYGFYSLSLNSESFELVVSFIGYSSLQKKIEVKTSIQQDFHLTPETSVMNEVIVRTQKMINPLSSNQFEVKNLTPSIVKELPIVFGEGDVLKAIQLQSGVTTLGEGSSSIFVQGGKSDQNVMLIDEAPIYNPSHLFGLVSVFNPDALKNVSFYKGNMPAQFGGKLSSVVDCHMNDGNLNHFQLSGGIGTLTSHLAIEGPIKKNTASYLIAVRRSIRDIFQNTEIEPYVPKFYDINTKLNWKINKSNRVYLSIYNSNDELMTSNNFTNKWGNTTTTFRWNNTINQRLFANYTAVYSNYTNNWLYTREGKNYQWLTGVKDILGKIDFSFYMSPTNQIRFGAETIYHRYTPGENESPQTSLFRVNAFESSIFVLHDINIGKFLGINYGLRAIAFQNFGEAQWYSYENHTLVGKEENDSGVYNTYTSIEPRITINIKPSEKNVIKLGYSRTSQFSQVVQNSIFSYTALQTWMPANKTTKPLFANMLSASFFTKLGKKHTFSAEAYYKEMENIIDYIDHSQLINNPYIETQLRSGKSTAYGATIKATRKTEKLSLSFSYTYSRVFNKIEDINYGQSYSALHDIPHDIRISANYKFSKRISTSAYWTFHSGFPITLPVGYISTKNNAETIPIYASRNSSRMPKYHRLDIALSLKPKPSNKRWKGTWSAGVYNAYGQFNPSGINASDSGGTRIYAYSFYSVIPNISYNFKF